MAVLGFLSATIIGLVLGALGGGGSILTVPVLVYIMGVPTVEATAYSLFVVGVTAAVGAVAYIRQGAVDIRMAALFAAPSLIAVFLTRRFLVPAIPQTILTIGSFSLSRETAIMSLFSITMLLAAVSMIRGCRRCTAESEGDATGRNGSPPVVAVLGEGLLVGTVTGIVGAGGGFLIIPALVLLGRVPMRTAVGTSLLIIAAKSLIGFSGDVAAATAINWGFLLPFTALALVGIVAGSLLSAAISSAKLKPAFGWFVLVMGTVITVQQMLAASATV